MYPAVILTKNMDEMLASFCVGCYYCFTTAKTEIKIVYTFLDTQVT